MEEFVEDSFLWNLVLQGYKSSIDAELSSLLTPAPPPPIRVEVPPEIPADLGPAIDKLSSQIEEKFSELKKVKEELDQKLLREDGLMKDLDDAYEKEMMRQDLIDTELDYYRRELEKAEASKVDNSQVVQISIKYCYERLKKIIPNFEEVGPC
jgi:vacuolar-type H+-ATPase subunit I/STV1